MSQSSSNLISDPRNLERPQLIAKILHTAAPVVLLDAPAGMGKTVLLKQLAKQLGTKVHASPPNLRGPRTNDIYLWDIPPGTTAASLPSRDDFSGRLIIAKRTETRLEGSERAELYGRLLRIGVDQLLFDAEQLQLTFSKRQTSQILASSGGWPMLLAQVIAQPDTPDLFLRFLNVEYLPEFREANLAALSAWLDGKPVSETELVHLAPLLTRQAEGFALCMPDQRDSIEHAVASQIEARLAEPDKAARIADAFLKHGKATEAITILQKVGYLDWALDVFVANGGMHYIYRHGPDALGKVLAGFPEAFAKEHEVLVISQALRAVKIGHVEHARRIITSHFGAAIANPATVFSGSAQYSLQLRYFRLMLLIYEDVPLTDALLEQGYGLIADAPIDAHAMRGTACNSLMEFYMRRRSFAEAEDLATRAHYHYEQAGLFILQFYISLHRAIMRLTFGDTLKAAEEIERATAELAQAGYDSPSDERLLSLVRVCVAFEQGDPSKIVNFLNTELEAVIHGEMWPSIAELTLQYGSFALAEHLSVPTARDYLDHWRVYQKYNRQFQAMIDIREAAVLQNANRWNEAADKLAAIPLQVNRDWVLRSQSDLIGLQTRDEILLALSWLRQIVFETPTRAGLEARLQQMARNLNLTGRQRFAVDLWLAYVYRFQLNQSGARRLAQKTIEDAGRLGCLITLAEERQFLDAIMRNQRIADFVLTSPTCRQTLRKLSEIGVTITAAGKNLGLTRRESRVLLFLSEGASNKVIAQSLGLSEATVKFHLSNVYRKLGCRRRKEAISAAKSLGLVS